LQSSVLDANKWENEEIEIVKSGKRKSIPMDVDYLSKKIKERANLDYSNKSFYTKDSHAAKPATQSHLATIYLHRIDDFQ